MEISEIRKMERVVDRLAAAGPSGIAPPHCWFCGKIEPWFMCDCKDAVAAQEGKRNKPRWVEKDGKPHITWVESDGKMLIVLDPDVIARPRRV